MYKKHKGEYVMKRKLFSFVLVVDVCLFPLVTVVGAAEPTMGEEKVTRDRVHGLL